jgi:hypothetical protein
LIAEIDDSLKRSTASNDVLEFSVAGLWTPREVERGLRGVHTTPVTPIASPVARPAVSLSGGTRPAARNGRKIPIVLAAAAAIAGVATAAIQALPELTIFSKSELPVVLTAPESVPGAVPMRAVAAHSEEEISRASAQLRDRDDEAFAAGFRALMKSASEGGSGAAELATRIVNEYGRVLTSPESAANRRQAFLRLAIAAASGSNTAAQSVGAFEKAYDEVKTPIVKSTWWSRGEGARPREVQRWIEDGLILAASGDRPAMLDQAFAIGHGRGREQDRAQSVRLYRQVIERSGDEDAFSKALRASAVRGLSSMLNAVVSGKDHSAAVGLQPQMETIAKAGAADMQFYLGLFSECVADPPDFDVAREWYRKAAMNVAWKNAAERKLALLGKWCPPDAN